MAARSIRHALLVLAAWAVLFAPGMAGGRTGGEPPSGPDEVALAIIAPTFGTDGIAAARTGGATDDVAAEWLTSAGDLPVPPAVSTSHLVASISRQGAPAAHSDEGRRSAPSRAPPSG